MGKLWALKNRKKRGKKKGKFSPALVRKLVGSPERNWTRMPWDSQKPRILKICRKKSAKIGIL